MNRLLVPCILYMLGRGNILEGILEILPSFDSHVPRNEPKKLYYYDDDDNSNNNNDYYLCSWSSSFMEKSIISLKYSSVAI